MNRCIAALAETGDVIDFVREIEGLDFAGSVEFLAAKTGIPLRYTDHNEGRRRNRRKEHAEIVQKAVDFYHQRLLEDPAARPARDYLRSRGYGGEVARQFRLAGRPTTGHCSPGLWAYPMTT